MMQTELEDEKIYKLDFKFETINHQVGGAYKYINESGDEIDKRYVFTVS